jgi:hypothetical protein
MAQKNGRLEEAMANLAQAKAALVQNQATFIDRMAALDCELVQLRREGDERLACIEAILLQHEQLLQALPEAVGKKFGFHPKKT